MKAIVTISANASQNEQSCIGPNNLTRQLVSEKCMENLLSNMLRGGNPLTVGVGLIIEIIRKNNSDYDPDVGAAPDTIPSSNDPIYLGTMLRAFARRVPDFMDLLLSPTHAVSDGDSQITIKRKELGVAFGNRIEPLGFDRFKTCELMAELLHCSNMGLLNERGSEAFIRQRDEERERLKAEGHLKANRPPDSAITEFSEGSIAFTNGISPIPRSSSTEETRKLGIANNSTEEDGFENVGHPAEDVDEIKDEFDEKSPFEIEGEPAPLPKLPTPARPRLDLDEEFVDEPLTSPRLEAVDEKETEIPESEIKMPEPLHPHVAASPTSPTSGLTSGVSSLAFDEDTAMENHDLSHVKDSKSPESKTQGSSVQNSTDASLAPAQNDESPRTHLINSTSPRELSPHPEDKPAPLFATVSSNDQSDEDREKTSESALDNSLGSENVNTAQGDEGDSSRSMLMGGSDLGSLTQFEYDVDGQPIVGDFLKIMFVEHQVVPTIIVRPYISKPLGKVTNRAAIIGFLLSIPLE